MFDFKSLVSSLLSKDSPDNDILPSATVLVRDLPQTEYFTATVEIIKAVAKISADSKMSLKERVRTLLYIDEKTHGIQRRLRADYLNQKPGSKHHLPTILAYWHELANAYHICVRLAEKSTGTSLNDELALATLRGLNYQKQLITWSAIRHLKPEATVWQQAYRFYQYAEAHDFSRTPMKLFENAQWEVTAETLLIHGCMMHLAQTDNMLQQEILATDRLLNILCQPLRLDLQPQPKRTVFLANLALPEPPRRMLRGMAGKDCRYWNTEPVTQKLADLMFDLDQRLPSALANFGLGLCQKDWSALCEKLAIRWSDDGGKSHRKAERSAKLEAATVDIGFERIAYLVKVQDDSSATQVETDDWRITDYSTTGLGLTYLGKNADELALGRLIRVNSVSHPDVLGIIRRLSRHKNGTLVGVEILGTQPAGITLLEADNPGSPPASALYITQQNSTKSQRWFLIPKLLAEPERELHLIAQGKTYKIRLKSPCQALLECAHIDFDTLAKLE
ncbi:PilZ domain-containing protein [Pseudogulbenkiania sp. MAI-1]|uniref:PilZ domain-containing protein n=1 Tax=Pseudogulbenkiania sp. MAI-1 TaxID=990370 RepID=UPI00045EA66D|nr:PilZ domain-containing protein [Pseudogulbenkiania sp. MAI-1]